MVYFCRTPSIILSLARKNGQPNQLHLEDDEVRWINEVLSLHPMGLSAEMELASSVRS